MDAFFYLSIGLFMTNYGCPALISNSFIGV